VDYVGAGTIEFIADASEGLRADRVWFMEMNTRLQVEHPVTEAITGVDLVEWQLRVAAGEPLPMAQDQLAIHGHAIEARLYAEDPAKGFLPAIGTLEVFDLGDDPAIRIDTGVEEGAEITPWYDPMIAKVIAHADTRDEAREALADALDEAVIWPVRTNAGFLVQALDHPDFASGQVDTGLIARDGEALMPPSEPSEEALAEAAAALVGADELTGFRLNAVPKRSARFLLDGRAIIVDFSEAGEVPASPTDEVLISEGGQSWSFTRWRADGLAAGGAGDGAILSPMPGRIIAVGVTEGQAVTAGQPLVTLEAMKMEHVLTAPFDGVVTDLKAETGGQVAEGVALVRIVAEDAA
jgi:3-methylcrotonyl-CoA carboxylase alpha subunit